MFGSMKCIISWRGNFVFSVEFRFKKIFRVFNDRLYRREWENLNDDLRKESEFRN